MSMAVVHVSRDLYTSRSYHDCVHRSLDADVGSTHIPFLYYGMHVFLRDDFLTCHLSLSHIYYVHRQIDGNTRDFCKCGQAIKTRQASILNM